MMSITRPSMSPLLAPDFCSHAGDYKQSLPIPSGFFNRSNPACQLVEPS